MANLEKHRRFARLRKEYASANRAEKTKILDGVCLTFHCRRNDAICLIHPPATPPPKRKKGRPPVYASVDFGKALKKLYLLADQPCSFWKFVHGKG